MKNAFYLFQKLFLFLTYLNTCPNFWGQLAKGLHKKAYLKFKLYSVIDWETNNYNTPIVQYHRN